MRTLLKLIPREHGAWAMWLIPYVAGSALALHPTWRLGSFALGALLLFIAHAELVRWGRRSFALRELRLHHETRAALLLGSAGLVLAVASTFAALTPLAAVYLLFVAVLAISTVALALLRLERTAGGELLGILLLTASGPVALIIGGIHDLSRLLAFHAINFLFFSLSIFYVRAKVGRLRERRGRLSLWLKARLGGVTLAYLTFVHLALWVLVRAGFVPGVMFLAFLPITVHTVVGLARLDQRVDLRRLGFAEVAQSLVFLLSVLVLWTR